VTYQHARQTGSNIWGGGHVDEWDEVEVGVLSDGELSWMKITAVCVLLLKVEVTWRT
jgi:hypothetical protein